jgi:hypothetical protein
MNYFILFKDAAGEGIAGLSPAWVYFEVAATGEASTPQPEITEVSHGRYTFDAAPTVDIAGRIDGGAGLQVSLRYVDVLVSPADEVTGSAILLPPMSVRAYTTLSQSRTVVTTRGDTPTVTFDLGADYTGWAPYFAVKALIADPEYAIAPKVCTWSNAAIGMCYVDLTAEDTGTAGKYIAEIELRKGSKRLTVSRFALDIGEDIIK